MQVDGISVAAAEAIADASIVHGYVNGSEHLILVTKDGTQIDAGSVLPEDYPVSFYIDGNGHLIMVGHNEDETDLGQVQWPTYVPPPPPAPDPTHVIFTSSGTLTKATYPEATRFAFQIWGGGGGGADGNSFGGSGAGGGGGYLEVVVPASLIPSTSTVTVGLGGAAGLPGGSSTVQLVKDAQFPADTTRTFVIGAGGGGGGFKATAAGQTAGTGGLGGYSNAPGSVIAMGEPQTGGNGTSSGNGTNAANYGSFGTGGFGLSSLVMAETLGNISVLGGDGGGRSGLNGIDANPGCIPAGGGAAGRGAGKSGGVGARGEVRVTVYYD